MNSNAEAYFSTRGSGGRSSGSVNATAIIPTPPNMPAKTTSMLSNATRAYGHVEISFSEPFIYRPLQGAKEMLKDVSAQFASHNDKRDSMPLTSEDSVTATEDYGYIPRTLIDWMVQQPGYVSQYPHLESCLAGGPSVVPGVTCTPLAPVYASGVPDLTTSLSYTVTSMGCFHPGACSVSTTPDAATGPTKKATAAVAARTGSSFSTAPSQPPSSPEASIPAPAGQPILSTTAPIIAVSKPSALTVTASDVSNPNAATVSSTNPTTDISAAIASAILSVSNSASLPRPSSSVSRLQPSPEKSIGKGDSATVKPTHPSTRAYSTLSQALIVSTSPEGLVTASNALASHGLGSIILSAFGAASNAVESLVSPDPQSVKPSSVGGQVTESESASMVGDGSTSAKVSPASTTDEGQHPNAEHGEQTLVTVFPSTASVLALGSQRVTFDVSSGLQTGSRTLIPGAALITVPGLTYSLAPSAPAIAISGISSQMLSIADKASSISDTTISLSNDSQRPIPSGARPQIIIGSQTLIPGASPIVISGVAVSLASSGNDVVIGQSTLTLPGPRHNASATSTIGGGITSVISVATSATPLHTVTLLPGPATTSSSLTGHGHRLDLGTFRSTRSTRLAGFATLALMYYQS